MGFDSLWQGKTILQTIPSAKELEGVDKYEGPWQGKLFIKLFAM